MAYTNDDIASLIKAQSDRIILEIRSAYENKELCQQSTNKPMPKLPTLAEVQMEVLPRVWDGDIIGTASDIVNNITEIIYNFICSKLSAG